MSKTVVIYSTPTCHFCHEAKDFFKAHDIAFTDYDVAQDAARRTEVVTKSGQMGVPVIVVTDEAGKEEVVIGFDEEKLSELLLGA